MLLPTALWLCVAASLMVRVWACSPRRCASAKPGPMWTGVMPRRSGRAKVVTPSPPYIVPIREYSAVFWLIAKI
jgi:hypothetical protein